MSDQGKRCVSVLLVGIGGMGHFYLQNLLSESSTDRVRLLAAVEPFPEKAELSAELGKRGIPVFPEIKNAILAGYSADLAVISSPLQHHVRQSLEALEAGSGVLCEKPLTATVQEADRLIREVRRKRQWVRIGFQWSYTKAVLSLKTDILSGRFGRPIRAKALHLWPREISYYQRNDWAGRIKDREGRWVLDSPVSSAMAHDLFNLLFLLGDRLDRSAQPQKVQAELYRANPIENYDTISCRIKTDDGVELLLFASHAVREVRGPFFLIEFEKGIVSFEGKAEGIVAVKPSGEKITYGSPLNENPFKKLDESVEAVRQPVPVLCGPEAARSHTLCVNGIQESMGAINVFSPPMLQWNERQYWAEGLVQAFEVCYTKGILPSEAGFFWGCEGRWVNLERYEYFPGGSAPSGEGGESD